MTDIPAMFPRYIQPRVADARGEQFVAGVALYDGTETLPLGDRRWAVPISTLWGA